MKTFKQFQEAAFAAPFVAGGISKIPATIGALTTLVNMAKKKNYGINLRVNRKAKKDDYYDGGEEKQKKKIQDKITKKDEIDVDKANEKMIKDITQKSKNSELEKNPVYQELNRPTDINQFVRGKKIDAKTRKRMNAPENQFEDAAPTNSVGDGSNVSLPPSYIPGMRKRKNYAKGGRNSRKPWLDYLKK